MPAGDPDYDGASGPLEFSGNGEPTEASYGILAVRRPRRISSAGTACEKTKECIDDSKTKFVKATAPETADVAQVPVTATREGDGELTIGTLLPITGSLAFLGPPEFAGVKLAIKEINENGGYNGKDVKYIEGDSGDTENKVRPGHRRHAAEPERRRHHRCGLVVGVPVGHRHDRPPPVW